MQESVGVHVSEPNDGEFVTLRPPPLEPFSPDDWSTADRLGFAFSPDPLLCAAEQNACALLDEAERRCDRHWQSHSRGLPLLTSATPEMAESLRALVRRCGVPRQLRGAVWLTLTGVASRMDENEGFCRALLARHGYMRGVYAEAIEKDLFRTFPGHRYFAPGAIGSAKARNVLHALCWRNPLLNYCQSFNYLVAFLLLVLDEEESTFWLMCHLLETVLPNDLYSELLIGAKVDQLVLQNLVASRLPRLAEHFEAVHFDVGTLVPTWLMVLFVNVFPVETVLRVWDALFAESPPRGETSCLPLQVVLAVLRLQQPALLRCADAGDVVMGLAHAARRTFDAERLMRAARDVRLTGPEVQTARRRARPDVLAEVHRRERRRRALRSQRDAPPAKGEAPGGGRPSRLSALPREPHQGEYSDYFAGTGFVEVVAANAWRRVAEANRRLESGADAHAVQEAVTRWGNREESVGGLEMQSIKDGKEEEEEEERLDGSEKWMR